MCHSQIKPGLEACAAVDVGHKVPVVTLKSDWFTDDTPTQTSTNLIKYVSVFLSICLALIFIPEKPSSWTTQELMAVVRAFGEALF